MSSHTDSLFGQIVKGLGRSSENSLWQGLVGLIAERAWEKANIKEVATSGGYEGARASEHTLDGYDVGYDEGQVDPGLAKAVNDASTPTPPSTRPDSLPDHLSHQGGGGNNGGAANPNANNGPPNSFGEYGRPDPSSQSGDGGSGIRATHYDSYPFHTGTLAVESINRGQDYFWSHYNEYNPHDSLDLSTPFGYCQNLARQPVCSRRSTPAIL